MIRKVWVAALLWTASLGWAAGPQADFSRLAWLEGEWRGSVEGAEIEEHWTSPAGGGLIGMHKEVREGEISGFEFLRIVSIARGPSDEGSGDVLGAIGAIGAIGYISSPNGAAPTTFRLTELGERRVVFENPEHDFPQRILYWLDANGALHARIDGMVGGKTEAMEWTWRRQ